MIGFRSFAVLPAAGYSRRMGVPKLLLPWKERTVIEQVLAVWQASAVDRVFVVLRQEQHTLIRLCRRSGVNVVVPEQPPAEMKHSVQAALVQIQHLDQPKEYDVVLLAPADMPYLTTDVIDRLLTRYDHQQPCMLLPVFGRRQGHPLLIPWSLSHEVLMLGPDQGVNSLLDRHPVRTLEVDDSACLQDLDHPVDYRPPEE
jgi:molybdenum cofactor cytidylyltransferase